METEFTGMTVLDVTPNPEALESYAVHVLIAGAKPLPYGTPMRARFDDEPIEELAIDMLGNGLTGYLKNEPAAGATLFLELEGSDPIDTGFAYARNDSPIA